MVSSISHASLSTLPPETNYIQIVYQITYFCWENKALELELENSNQFLNISDFLSMFYLKETQQKQQKQKQRKLKNVIILHCPHLHP